MPRDVAKPGLDCVSQKKGKKRRWRQDRYYGRFCCQLCKRQWDSSLVFTKGGTKKVMFRQRCHSCTGDKAWVFPFHLELLQCRQCSAQPCVCVCDQCGNFKHKRYMEPSKDVNPDTQEPNVKRKLCPEFDYCDCQKSKNIMIGSRIDKKKPHRSDLCERCRNGIKCSRRQVVLEAQDGDNEP